MPFYAVAIGKKPGVYEDVEDFYKQVRGFSGAVGKKFTTREEALQYIDSNKRAKKTLQPVSTRPTAKKPKKQAAKRPAEAEPKNSNSNLLPLSAKRQAIGEWDSSFLLCYFRRMPVCSAEPDNGNDIPGHANKLQRTSDPSTSIRKDAALTQKHNASGTSRKELTLAREGNNRNATGQACSTPAKDAVRTAPNNTSVLTAHSGSRISQVPLDTGYGVYWGHEHPDNFASPVQESADVLAGCYQAAIYAMQRAAARGYTKLAIYSDDPQLGRNIQRRLKKWKRRDWMCPDGSPVPHADLLKKIDVLQQQVQLRFPLNAESSAVGPRGQRMADKLAFEGARRTASSN